MTPQEQQLLQDLTAKINQTVLPDKDLEAEQFLNQSLGRNPDSLYILAQTVLVQNYALDQAKQQIEQLKQQMQQAPAPQKHGSFLGNLLGMNDQEQAAPPPPPQYAPVQTYAQPAGYGGPQYGQAPMQYGSPQPAGGGFLQSAMRTATGVAAGALAFEGIESLMNGFGHHAGYGGGSGLGGFDGGGGQPREEVINNYYGDDARESGRREASGDSFGDRLANDRSGDRSDDLEDRRDDSRSFADSDDSVDDGRSTSDDSSGNDNFDPTGNDSSF